MARYSALTLVALAIVLALSVTEAVRVPDAFSVLRSPADDVKDPDFANSEKEFSVVLDGGEGDILEMGLESVFSVPRLIPSDESAEVVLDGGVDEEVKASARAAMLRSQRGFDDLIHAVEESDNQRESADVVAALNKWMAEHPTFEVTSLFEDDGDDMSITVNEEEGV